MARKILGSALLAFGLACGPGDSRDAAQTLDAGGARETSAPADTRAAIVFLGTSLTAGLGLTEDQAFPALIQDTLDALGIPLRVVNSGVSGETTAGGLRRIGWLVRQPVSVLVVELGANDGLRGLDVDAMRSNLQTIIDRTKAAHPDARIVLLGMQAPPNLGGRYTQAFSKVFSDLAATNGTALVPFLLEGVAGVPELNQTDGIHPTAGGHELLARTVWRVLERIVRQ